MGKKKDYQLNGQLCFDFNTNTEHYVVQSNELLEGKQNLKLNSAKIVRALIMQIKPDDEELKSYFISVQELAKMLHISAANLYRDMDTITDDILTNHVAIKDYQQGKFMKIQWVTACAYEKGVGLAVKMTQYQLENILAMKSVYAIRIYELLMKEQMTRFIPADGVSVILAIKTIREACDCETKYEKISQFKSKVIDIAVKEICRCTSYTVSYECLKKGRSIEAFRFHLNSKYNKI